MSRPLRSGVLLAGGTSSRFGSPKGLAPFFGQRLSDQPLRALHAICDEVLVAANEPEARDWFPDLRVVADATAERSALAGLITALTHASHDIVVVCAWDMPFMVPSVLGALAMTVELGTGCCVPQHESGALEPLAAAYRREVCLPLALHAQGNGGGAAKDLLRLSNGTAWSIADNMSPSDEERLFFNVNTPDDLVRAHRMNTPNPSI